MRALLVLLLLSMSSAVAAGEEPWWRHAVIYEIYPRSFQDSNGDGIGDLNGITSRLDYLRDLGVDAIWMTPVYPSPQVDFGYDISDYEAIDPQYGTLADFDRLVAEAKRRNIRVVMDMVLNHTSDQHAWFLAASRSRTDPHHDYYVWAEGRPGPGGTPLPPNNWVSLFGGSAWQWVPAVRQFFYHDFYKQQPDLNFGNPAVEKAMFDAIRFWLDRGVAGYRLDAIPSLFEDPRRRDEPIVGGKNAQGDLVLQHIYTDNLPEVHAVVRRLRAMVQRYAGDRVLIGETYLPDTAALDAWYGGAQQDELQLPMNMQFGFHGAHDKLDATRYRQSIVEMATMLHGGQPLLVFDNHDNPRSWDRFADGIHDAGIARIIAALLLTTRSSALLYYGQELGMRTTPPTRKQDVRDPIGITGWPDEKGRDGERTPMTWDGTKQAGFTTSAAPWLPVATSPDGNVQAELASPGSLLSFYRQLIALRRSNAALREGDITVVDAKNPAVLSYVRGAGNDRVLVSLNMSDRPQTLQLARELGAASLKPLLTSEPRLRNATSTRNITLSPYATFVAAIH